MTPFLGPRKVVILGDADRLIVQEASQEAANALLKVLEEPPADTSIMLTTADPEALLPTIRSRAVPLRVGRVPDTAVRRFLEEEVRPKQDPQTIDRRVVLAEGSISDSERPDRGSQQRTSHLEPVGPGTGALGSSGGIHWAAECPPRRAQRTRADGVRAEQRYA
jgi:hypothetical protein